MSKGVSINPSIHCDHSQMPGFVTRLPLSISDEVFSAVVDLSDKEFRAGMAYCLGSEPCQDYTCQRLILSR